MNNLLDFMECFRAKGLFVHTNGLTTAVVGVPRTDIDVPKDRSITTTRFGRCVDVSWWELDHESVLLEDSCYVMLAGSQWVFRSLLPGVFGSPNYDDVFIFRDSLAAISEVTENYFFKPPITIDNWTIPVYQHPDWDVEEVLSVIDAAKHASPTEYRQAFRQSMEEASRRERAGVDGLYRDCCDDLYYYTPPRIDESGPILHLRLDCKEAYICPSC